MFVKVYLKEMGHLFLPLTFLSCLCAKGVLPLLTVLPIPLATLQSHICLTPDPCGPTNSPTGTQVQEAWYIGQLVVFFNGSREPTLLPSAADSDCSKARRASASVSKSSAESPLLSTCTAHARPYISNMRLKLVIQKFCCQKSTSDYDCQQIEGMCCHVVLATGHVVGS